MEYSLIALKSKGEGETLKIQVTAVKDDLDYKRDGLNRQKKGMKGSGTVTAELNAAILKANSHRAFVAELTDADMKEEEGYELNKLDYEVSKLQKKSKMKGAIALITTEMEIDLIEVRIAAIDALLVLVDARIAELPA